MIVAATVLVFAVGLAVAGRLVAGALQSRPTAPVATSSTTPVESTAANSGPWHAYGYVAAAVPGLIPDTPSGTSYQGGSCQPVDTRFDPVDNLEGDVPVARIVCTPAVRSYLDNYVVVCNGDRTPQTLSAVADGLDAARSEQWSRGGASGQVAYGEHDGAGALVLGFDTPDRNFCSVVANGRHGTSGRDVYDHWFRDAPL
jgi:serine/threonine-protein kinase